MTVPQSLLVVALAVAWLIILVPASSRRRRHVRPSVEGSGFRVLRRSPAARSMRARRAEALKANRVDDRHPAHVSTTVQSEGQMTSWHTGNEQSADRRIADDDTVVLDTVPAAPGSEYAENTQYTDNTQYTQYTENTEHTQSGEYDDDAPYGAAPGAALDATGADGAPDEAALDDAALREQYRAWRESTRTPPVPEETSADVRPIPRRSGRGTFDPEAAERARAYKYARRRRAVLVLALLTIGFAVAAVVIASSLWIGAVVSGVLLALFLTYLRRQVKIENDIRERRLAKLERARQIRPERVQADEYGAAPYAQRAPRSQPGGPGPVHHRTSRQVVDLDDDDPGFDDLEQYEPMEYRRAVGQ